MGRERGPDGARRGGLNLGRLAFKRAARRSDFERALDGGVEPLPHRDIEEKIDGLHRDRGEAGLAEHPIDPRLGGERERPRILGTEFGQTRRVAVSRLERQHQPGVLARLAPAGESEAAARPQPLAHIGEGKRRIGEEHHAEARKQQIHALRPARRDRRSHRPR